MISPYFGPCLPLLFLCSSCTNILPGYVLCLLGCGPFCPYLPLSRTSFPSSTYKQRAKGREGENWEFGKTSWTKKHVILCHEGYIFWQVEEKKCAPKGGVTTKTQSQETKHMLGVINGITPDISSISLFLLNLWISFIYLLMNVSYLRIGFAFHDSFEASWNKAQKLTFCVWTPALPLRSLVTLAKLLKLAKHGFYLQ